MVEYTRDKILPEDMIQRTNLQQHNFMIDAINDIDGRQSDIEGITNVNIDDIADLKTDVVALSNEKLDKADIDADLHFGDISVTRDGTAVIMSLDVFNPTTGITTPISFTIPGATSALAGSMDASSVAWIADAENRISALEGLSDVKAVSGLSSAPTQEQLNYAWVAATSKQAETGDIIQDINNSKLWVFVGTDWVLYGTIVAVPLATTSTIGGVRDTSLTTPGNRWYVHVEADGRLSLIGGDVLSTLVDTTVPALQSGVNNSVKKTGDTMTGVLTLSKILYMRPATGPTYVQQYNTSQPISQEEIVTTARYGGLVTHGGINNNIVGEVVSGSGPDRSYWIIRTRRRIEGTDILHDFSVNISPSGEKYVSFATRSVPNVNDGVNVGYLNTRLTTKQDTLVFDSTPILNSVKPVTSGGVYNALIVKADKSELMNGLALKADKTEVSDGLALKADKTEVSDGLALKVNKGGSITASSVISFTNVASNTWRQCSNKQVTNFVTFICEHQNFNVDISPDMSEITNVCKKANILNADGSETTTFMVPTNWYYRVIHSYKPNRIIEQPITIN